MLQCVRTAEKKLGENATPRNYLPIDGIAAYDRAVQETLFGKDTPAVKDGRIVTVQTLGGTGGLKVGGDFLKRFNPGADIYISDPSWENHRAIFEYAGYTVKTYPYYDAATNGLKFDAMLACFEQLPARAIVLLHACCHNPTGVDLTPEQWEKVIDVVNRRDLVPFLDIAYQGFAEGLEEDAATIRRFTAECSAVFVSSSFSKSMFRIATSSPVWQVAVLTWLLAVPITLNSTRRRLKALMTCLASHWFSVTTTRKKPSRSVWIFTTHRPSRWLISTANGQQPAMPRPPRSSRWPVSVVSMTSPRAFLKR